MTDAQIQAQIESNRKVIEEAEAAMARASQATQEIDQALSQALGCSIDELETVLRNRVSADEWRQAEAEFEKSLQDAGIAPVTPTNAPQKTSTVSRPHRRMV
jgi:hypothetical protein